MRLARRGSVHGFGEGFKRRGELSGIEVGNGLSERKEFFEGGLGGGRGVFKQAIEGEDKAFGASGLLVCSFLFVAKIGGSHSEFLENCEGDLLRPGADGELAGVFINGNARGWRLGWDLEVRKFGVVSEFLQKPDERVSFVSESWVGLGKLFELPQNLAKSDSLADEPCFGTVKISGLAPMLWFGDRLPVEFKNQFRMAGGEKRNGNRLMAGDAGVCAGVKIFQVAHTGGDALGVGIIGARVGAKPMFRGTMAGFAGNAFVYFK